MLLHFSFTFLVRQKHLKVLQMCSSVYNILYFYRFVIIKLMEKYSTFLKFLLLFLVLTQLFLPFPSYSGLVPCGLSEDDPDQPGDQTVPCTFCHFFKLFENIVDFVLFKIVPPLAMLMLAIGGAMFIIAGGDPRKIGQARSILTAVVLGLFIVYGAWLLINLFFSAIGVADWTGLTTGWAEFQCVIKN